MSKKKNKKNKYKYTNNYNHIYTTKNYSDTTSIRLIADQVFGSSQYIDYNSLTDP